MATGHIRKRILKDGTTNYQITVEGDRDPITGKRERKYKTVKGTRKQATAEMHQLIQEMKNGTTSAWSTLKVKDWLNSWLTLYCTNIAQSTRDGYEESIRNRLNPYIGEIPLNLLTNIEIQKWVNELNEKNLAPKTVKNVALILHKALDKAVSLRMIQYNPCNGTDLPTIPKYHAQVYSSKEINQALKYAKGTSTYLIALLGFSVGLRRGELLALTWSDIDFKNKIIHVNKSAYKKNGIQQVKQPKTSAGIRTISVGDNVINDLKQAYTEYINRMNAQGLLFSHNNLVVCKDDGTPYHEDSITQKWNRFTKKHNLKHIRFHDTRHSNATLLIANNVDPKTVQQRLGHSDIRTTLNIYTHCTKEMDANAAEKIDNIFTI